ncbi:retrotransposon hot spot (RHS) protein, putative [Trypanosoma brucei brucei TREU927]|uniref:Retrotransposon hot spot (RHS) protein, putative n=1 Tax=Trypanosoma brucei brucei (strain 927/4 GUTat10.1) TaxID=185431 RepID=Q38CT3_TRYB2|nr:retrotransposon hot spot protein [Trypanosoma brucei brucei TREU927]EAN77387.1 retrotransposon hot spot (RHS) protein, putative [Trypanosoma brucei brucei TREU927]
MPRANRPAPPQRNNANQQMAGNVEVAMRRPRDENVPPPPPAAQPPQIRQRTEEGPNWTMNSEVEDVLLEDYAVLRKMTVNDFIQEFVGGTFAVAEAENVRMPIFVKNPRRYIADAEILEDIQGTDEFEEYKELYNQFSEMNGKARYLDEKEIYYLRQWEEKGRGEIREFVGPMARGRLDAAVTAAKRAEKRAAQTAGGAVNLEGVYDSICNATWSYVVSGYDEEPLGMKVFGGRPRRIWTEEEVDVTPEPANVDSEMEERPNGLEIIVLTSERGWPHNRFVLGYSEKCKAVSQHVYIRREIMRVWYIIQQVLKAWWVDRSVVRPPIHVVIGTHGIGKSCGLGSFLFYSLFHFNEGMLDVVAYFLGEVSFLIYNRKDDERGRVVRYEDSGVAVRIINNMKYEKRGHIIIDISGMMQKLLYTQLPSDIWGVTLLTSPNSGHFDEWTTNTGGRQIIMNCDDVCDIKAFMAWKKLSIHAREKVFNKRRYELRKEMEDEWRIVEGRINSIGPLPRYIFGLGCYEWRLKSVHDALETMKKSGEYSYSDIIGDIGVWQNNEVTDKLVKVIRVNGNAGVIESYSCQALSVMIRNMMMN